ncbi:MAG: hypothetical protein ACXVYI_17160, partial [Mycobacterium sp.]
SGVCRRRFFDVMSLPILPARTPGNRVAQQLDHYDGLTSVVPGIERVRVDLTPNAGNSVPSSAKDVGYLWVGGRGLVLAAFLFRLALRQIW